MTIDDSVLLAYLDGQLDDTQYTPVEDALANSPALRERLQALVDSGERVQRAFDAKLQEPVPARLVEAVMRAPLNLTAPVRRPAHAPATPWQQLARHWRALWATATPGQGGWGRAAFASVAVLALGVWLGQALQNDADPAAALAQGQPIADPALASALELAPSGRRLATSQGHVEVLATFEHPDGGLCREFERQQGDQVDAGIACRRATADAFPWQTAMVATDTRPSGGYHTASDAQQQAVNRFVDRQLRPTPLDAAVERALIEQAWSRSP